MEQGRFLERLNRFVARVHTDTGEILCHVPSTGRMRELLYAGNTVWLERKATGKTQGRLLFAMGKNGPVSVDSTLPNRLVHQDFLHGGQVLFSGSVADVRPEVRLGDSRIDFRITLTSGEVGYVEVKSVTLVEEGVALFPDAPTERGTHHLMELAKAAKDGYFAAVVFVIQREDARVFRPHREKDAAFADAVLAAAEHGVQILAVDASVSPEGVSLRQAVPVELV